MWYMDNKAEWEQITIWYNLKQRKTNIKLLMAGLFDKSLNIIKNIYSEHFYLNDIFPFSFINKK